VNEAKESNVDWAFETNHSVNSIIYMNGAANNKCETRKKAGQR